LRRVILIQNSASTLGGVETLVARLAHTYRKTGIEVTVIVLASSANSRIVKLLPDGCRIILVPPQIYSNPFFPIGIWGKSWDLSLPKECDLILSFSGAGAIFMRLLRKAKFKNAREIVYVVHPYMMRPDFHETPKYGVAILRDLAEHAALFINQACRDTSLQNETGFVGMERIIPLPIVPLKRVLPVCQPFRVISIGRIEPLMKTYNWTLVPKIAALSRSHRLVWEIYGGGSEEDVASLKAWIDENRAKESVKYFGELPYEQMETVLSGALAFIGMGTAALEAASAGVPVIVATAYEQDASTYGMLYELPFPCVGEMIADQKSKGIDEVLLELISLSREELLRIGEQCREHALRFSTDNFIGELELWLSSTKDIGPMTWRNVSGLAIRCARDRVVRKLGLVRRDDG